MRDAVRPQHLHRFANHRCVADLTRVRHESQASRSCSLHEWQEWGGGDRLIADESQADDAFGRQRGLERPLVVLHALASDQLDKPGDLHPELVHDPTTWPNPAVDPPFTGKQAPGYA